jgi:elongation factor 2
LRLDAKRGLACHLRTWLGVFGYVLLFFLRVFVRWLAHAKQGDSYFDSERCVWSQEAGYDGTASDRSFNAFILGPIFEIYDAYKSDGHRVQDILDTFGITLDDAEQQLSDERLLQAAMHRLFPACDTILEMICTHLPSPVSAQQYRSEWLYQGPLDDEAGAGIHTCDENGPLVLYITRSMPTADDKSVYFLGRVLSGTVTADQDVRTLQGHWRSPRGGSITRTSIIAGLAALTLDSVPVGNIVAVQGKLLTSSSSQQSESEPFTITASDVATRCRDMTFMDMAALYVTAGMKDEADTPFLVLGIRSLSRSNPYINAFVNDQGQYVIHGFDELQVQTAVKELRALLGGRRIRISEPLFRYREGIKSPSEETCMARSPNKKIRLYVRASPLSEQLTKEISSGEIPTVRDSDRRTKYLANSHSPGWPPEVAEKIWSFAPLGSGPNILVDSTVAVQYVSEVRDSLTSGFQWAVHEGPLCEEPLRGVRIDVVDIVMMTDARGRGGGQLIPTMRRAVYGSVLRARPFLLEAVYCVEVYVHSEFVNVVRGILGDRRGGVFNDGLDPSGLHVMQAHIRSGQVVGLQGAILSAAGESSYVCIWCDRWEEFEGDREALVRSIRERKGLPPTVTSWETVSSRVPSQISSNIL